MATPIRITPAISSIQPDGRSRVVRRASFAASLVLAVRTYL
ncbi:hypothetical protein RB2654_14895 [Rhodobacterales bacterium HTCC2654]|uniref:Uncharacterized protein n=1 Tax=Maritimibacter alkaliphilus HTCC2654 TaxID=314271 RepID=A3VH28_9RHOB|nr:hypothetical protein RB2654_14895 [Rhodobacterales bacterium HTCC2654] [Maritimibacter alkaliphilus HTCC2654]